MEPNDDQVSDYSVISEEDIETETNDTLKPRKIRKDENKKVLYDLLFRHLYSSGSLNFFILLYLEFSDK